MTKTYILISFIVAAFTGVMVVENQPVQPVNKTIKIEYDSEYHSDPVELESADQIKLAISASKQKDYLLAEKIYQQVLIDHPFHQTAILNLGLMYKKQNNCEQALVWFKKAKSFTSGSRKGKNLALAADCLAQLNQFESSLAHFEKAVEFRPAHKLTWYRLAQAKAKAGQPYKVVIEAFGQAIAIDPENQQLWLRLAEYQISHLDFWSAVRLLKKIDESKFHTRKLELLFISYAQLGSDSSTEEMLERLKDTQSLKYESFKNLRDDGFVNHEQLIESLELKTYLRQRRAMIDAASEEQFELIDRLLSMPIYQAEVAFDATRLAIEQALFSRAQGYIGLALNANPDKRRYLLEEAKIFIGQKKWAIAQEKMKFLITEFPNSSTVVREYARLLKRLKKYDRAKPYYEQLIVQDDYYKDRFELAQLLARQQQYQESNQWLNEVLVIKSNFISARLLLAKNYCLLGRIESCLAQAKLVVSLDSNNRSALDIITINETQK